MNYYRIAGINFGSLWRIYSFSSFLVVSTVMLSLKSKFLKEAILDKHLKLKEMLFFEVCLIKLVFIWIHTKGKNYFSKIITVLSSSIFWRPNIYGIILGGLKYLTVRLRAQWALPKATKHVSLASLSQRNKAINRTKYKATLWALNLLAYNNNNNKVTIITVVIGAFGTVTKGLLKGLED